MGKIQCSRKGENRELQEGGRYSIPGRGKIDCSRKVEARVFQEGG